MGISSAFGSGGLKCFVKLSISFSRGQKEDGFLRVVACNLAFVKSFAISRLMALALILAASALKNSFFRRFHVASKFCA